MKTILLSSIMLLTNCNGLSISNINNEMDRIENEIDTKLFLYETPMGGWLPSTVYKYADFRESLSVMATEGVAGKKFYIGEDVTNGHVYGLVNIAAFLAQSMKETIKYDACDENSWDLVGGKYPLSNACGQLGQSYQDYHCSEEEKHMECPVDPNMSITAVTHAKWYGAPAPLYCGPKTNEQPHSGFWDYGYECNKGWANPPETCDVYEGQKAGKFDQSRPYANTAGRTDVEGCCWWGRGVIQTSGICNFGKLNYYLGARAAQEGRDSKYPSVDFCKDPEKICSSSEYKELKWIAGMFYWMESVQPYDEGGWNYTRELQKFVEGGMQGTSFIDAVSGIVNRGCHNPPCGTGALDGGHERSTNFKKVLDAMFDGSPPKVSGSVTSSLGGPSSQSLFSPDPPSQTTGDKWYPDYNGNWAEGKCINVYPAPSGRPHYDSKSECCARAYGGQASGVCIGLTEESSSNTDSATISVDLITPQPTRKPVSPSSEAGVILNSDTFIAMDEVLEAAKDDIDTKLFLYETPSFQWVQSSVYKYADFRESLYVMATQGVAGKKFYIGEDVTNGHVYGLVNIAAFLAQSMKETIKYDACDENSWDLVGGKYPLSNACGQLGQSYQDYHCSEEEKHMECPVDPNMSITAVTHAKWYGAPAPLYCGPKTNEQPHSGFWDYGYECNKGWANPPETCDVYEGQKAGKFDHSRPYANTAGRTDVEGCCWWGRGVIQTTGVCNFGKLNYYLGARAAQEGRDSKYPSIDFCKDPEKICSSSEYKELKWIAGMFYWMESVQSYDEGGWNYTDELRRFVEGGMQGTSFIDAVSGIVNRGCHNPPCGTGAVDGGLERSQNFKKVLDTMFDGSPPEVAGPISNVQSPANPSSPTIPAPSSPSPPISQTTGDKWYPDYSMNWAEGKCINVYPAPSGRPHYDSQSECCAKAYGNQASGVCVGLIPPSPVDIPSIPSSSTPDLSTSISVTTQPTDKPVVSFSIEETTQPVDKPETSSSIEETGSKWYPDYNPIWALGACSNISPAPSGRPHYQSQAECCKMAYNGQASGACVGYTTSIVSKLETYYPDYSMSWAEGKCTNAYPAPSGRPQYNSQQECCEKAYAGQSSGACINDAAVSLAVEESTLDKFYPDYNPLWSLGVCTNKAPLPSGRPIYSSQAECCEFAYRGQASGACVNHEPRNTSNELVPFAESFTSEFMAPHAVLRSNFIMYSCGESNTIPYDTAIMDILFDYEVSLPDTVHVKHALPSLKKEIMDGLADTLNCQVTHRRGLRKVSDGTLLGFQSVEGSDVIDGEKGSCTATQAVEGERCYPVIGHIAAVMKFESNNVEVQGVKEDILQNIRHTMVKSSISDASGIEYINEHQIADTQQTQEVDDTAGDVKVTTDSSSSRPWVAAICFLFGTAIGVTLTLFVVKRRRIANVIASIATHDIESSDESISVEKPVGVEETARIRFSLDDLSSRDESRSGCSSASSDCDDNSSMGENVDGTSQLYQQDECKHNQSQPGSLDEYISKTHNNPSLFAGFKHSVQTHNIFQPYVESESTRQNDQVEGENAAMGLLVDAVSDENDSDAHDGDEIDVKHEKEHGESTLEVVEDESTYDHQLS